MNSAAKNEQIKNSIKQTRDRHAEMFCRVFEVKVVFSKLNRQQKADINTLFREGKWRRNDIIADVDGADRDAKSAVVKCGDVFETRKFSKLSSQMVQDIYDNVKSEIKGLATKKEQGEKVGALKFKSFCNCIPLRQHGNTYTIDFAANTVKVAKIKKAFRVRGLWQIPKEAEIANAKFIRKADGLYFHITTYTKPSAPPQTGCRTGIDFGISHNLTFSNGTVVDIHVPESKGVKLASRRLNRSLKKNNGVKSRRHNKRRRKLRAAYQKDTNRKSDLANKIVHNILSENDIVAIQDEMIHNWHSGLFGKQVQHSAMGSVKAKLKKSSKVLVVDRSFPSTQICPVCGCRTKHPLSIRYYQCAHCGYYHPSRDAKSAQCILNEATGYTVSAERRTYSPGEVRTSASEGLPSEVSCKSMTREAQLL